jgi:4-hydroxy-L-threonine phosphate dehydrogenase PdxA
MWSFPVNRKPISQMPDTRIIITSGEPAGIGPDIIAAIDPRAFAARLVVIGDYDMLRARAAALGTNTAFVLHGDNAASAMETTRQTLRPLKSSTIHCRSHASRVSSIVPTQTTC